MTMQREIRAIGQIERRADGDGVPPRMAGYAAVFNSPADIGGWWEESIAPGAFAASLARDDIRALWNHDSNYVLGRTSAGTLRLSEDERGLRFELDPPDTSWARDLMASIGRGDVSQCSFGFIVRKQMWDESDPKKPKRTLQEVELLEVSPVTWPAYADTEVGVRSLEQWRAAAAPKDSRAAALAARLRMDLGLRLRVRM